MCNMQRGKKSFVFFFVLLLKHSQIFRSSCTAELLYTAWLKQGKMAVLKVNFSTTKKGGKNEPRMLIEQ